MEVSIRFEVRGGFRLTAAKMTAARHQVSIRFEVRGGFRLVGVATLNLVSVSIRFEVRGGFRRRR